MSDKSWRDDLGDIAADEKDDGEEKIIYIYRIYEPFHETDESGTYEYGYYDSLVKAKKRLSDLIKKSEEEFKEAITKNRVKIGLFENGMGYKISSGFDDSYIYIEEIELNKDIDETNVGYT